MPQAGSADGCPIPRCLLCGYAVQSPGKRRLCEKTVPVPQGAMCRICRLISSADSWITGCKELPSEQPYLFCQPVCQYRKCCCPDWNLCCHSGCLHIEICQYRICRCSGWNESCQPVFLQTVMCCQFQKQCLVLPAGTAGPCGLWLLFRLPGTEC